MHKNFSSPFNLAWKMVMEAVVAVETEMIVPIEVMYMRFNLLNAFV